MYRDPSFLRAQIQAILDFYLPVVIDERHGGYIHGLKDDGTVFDSETKHLVGTCRHIYNFSTAFDLTGVPGYLDAARHGLEFLERHHRQDDGGYAWVLDGQDVADGSRHAYGHAFVLLAAATAAKASIQEAGPLVMEVFGILESHFWSPEAGLYADVIEAGDWAKVDPYRGQNANMHMCEAMLAAHEATGKGRYLERAEQLAQRICLDLAAGTDGLVWEHYNTDWSVDWDYNIDDPQNLFRPHGYVAGHFVEWAKLLISLYRVKPDQWMLDRAKALFEAAVSKAWDANNGGFHYTFGPDGAILDTDRYYWVLSEAIAAAALLATETNDSSYWRWYEDFWEYSDRHFIDHQHGGWYRVLDVHGRKYDDLKSPPAKTDYHPLSACHVSLQAIEGAR